MTENVKLDDDLLRLCAEVNKKAKEGRVNFFATQDGDAVAYAVIFQTGSKRATIRLRHKPTEADIDDIVQGLEAWAGNRDGGLSALYTTEVPKPPASEWSF